MGVDLSKLIAHEDFKIESLNGHTIAIDGNNALYQFLATIRDSNGEPLRDASGHITSHLVGAFNRIMRMLELNARPLIVFDGKPPELKRQELDARKELKEEARIQYNAAVARGDMEAAKKYSKRTILITRELTEDVKALMGYLGVPTFTAPSEGEAQAAVLNSSGRIDFVASQDYDALLFGGRQLLRNLAVSTRRRVEGKYVSAPPERVDLVKVLNTLSITREQLIDVAILVGTDFNPGGVPGIGPKRAYDLIKKSGRLEAIDAPDIQAELRKVKVEEIRGFFLNPPVEQRVDLSWGSIDEAGLKRFLVDEHSFSEERVAGALEKLKKSRESQSESLEKYF